MTDEILMLSLSAECLCFFHSCVLGAALGLLFDLISALRRVFSFSALHIALQDVFYCIISTLAVFAFLMERSRGCLRWYVFIGALLGWIIFRFTVGRIFTKIVAYLINALLKILLGAINIITAPVLKLILIIWSGINKICKLFYQIAKKICQNRKFYLKRYLKILYNSYIPLLRFKK